MTDIRQYKKDHPGFEDALRGRKMTLGSGVREDGIPCSHPGCLNHISHPCERCGRIGGKAMNSNQEFHEMIGKRCSRCNEIKSLFSFYLDKRSKDGLMSACKSCRYETLRKWRDSYPEKYREISRKNGKKIGKISSIHSYISYHTIKGNIIRPSVCSLCNKENKDIHAHHNDYSRKLDVVWVCRLCHKKIHKEIKKLEEISNNIQMLINALENDIMYIRDPMLVIWEMRKLPNFQDFYRSINSYYYRDFHAWIHDENLIMDKTGRLREAAIKFFKEGKK